jgi:hypothetical protein
MISWPIVLAISAFGSTIVRLVLAARYMFEVIYPA